MSTPSPRIKGTGVANLRECILREFKEVGLQQVLAKVSAPTAKMLRMPLAVDWYPLEQVVEVELAVAELFWRNDISRARIFGQYSIHRSINGVYRAILRVFDTTFLLKKSGELWSSFMDSGRLELTDQGANRVTVNVRDFNGGHPIYCHDLGGAFEECLVTCGGKNTSTVLDSDVTG